MLLLMTLFVGWIIWSIIIWPKGLSPGKQLLRLRVLDARTRQPPNRATMATRELVAKLLLQFVSLGIVTIVSAFTLLFSGSRQAVWDKIVGTVVVDEAAGRRERTGWVLLGLALLSFIAAIGATDQGGDTTDSPIIFVGIMVAASAGFAIAGIALLLTSVFRSARGRS